MDLSTDVVNVQKQIGNNLEGPTSSKDLEDILDLSGLDLDNEETWLYEPQSSSTLKKHQNNDLTVPKLKSTKTIDTRTFTRPKKKYNRPSINDIEQILSGNEMNSSFEDNKLPQTVHEELEPLQFDLSQPTSHNFDGFLHNHDGDLFQNMSPPSLVNSLCSSTFANLMESSFIRNDPILREIRDKDFTETALLQNVEAPMFQSITESCSSLNSDSPESFLKKVSRDNTIKINNLSGIDDDDDDNNVTITVETNLKVCRENNDTFQVQNISENDQKNLTFPMQPQTIETSSQSNLNGTYRRTPKHNGTFRKADLKNNRLSLNLTGHATTNVLDRDISKSIENDMNNSNKSSLNDLDSTRTRSIILQGDSIENLKNRFSSSEGSVDLNRLSYCKEVKQELNPTYSEDKIGSELNRTVEIKRSSLGSADSLDRMSSLSSSSKGSNKVLSIEDVEAIVELQERSLTQVMSTPKAPLRGKKLWDNNFISPIVSNTTLSDSELSDEYKSVKLNGSSKLSLKKPISISQKPLGALPSNIRASYSNISTLKNTTMTLGGSQQSLYRPPSMTGSQQNLHSQITRPSSNLKMMGTKLKGSYTSLRPISANLPVVPPVGASLNGTRTISRSRVNLVGTGKIEVQQSGDGTFIKPQLPKASGLPRPTGIPRPSSRIPGPRSSNLRPSSSRNY